MANEEHLAILAQGVEAWNHWRDSDDGVRPDLSEADLSGAKLSEADLFNAGLRGADLSAANLFDADLSRADLSGASLYRTKLVGAVLAEANLSKATLFQADLSSANLSEADLSEAYLGGAYLSGADLLRANLAGAILGGANLFRADLSRANLAGADLYRAALYYANLPGANLSGANLSGASLEGTVLTDADLTGCRVFGVAAWKVNLLGAKQQGLILTDRDEPEITVDNLEVAQFIYLLLHNEKLRDVINTVAQKAVLILGRFGGGGLEVLHSIAAKLREKDYLPIIFDFERPQDRNYTETVKTLVGLSRFVIVDLSGPSVPQELYATVPHFKIPFVPILEEGRRPYAMFADLLENHHVLKPLVVFRSTGELIEKMEQHVIAPAEARLVERQALLKQLLGPTG